jgi:hypothetical protein
MTRKGFETLMRAAGEAAAQLANDRALDRRVVSGAPWDCRF